MNEQPRILPYLILAVALVACGAGGETPVVEPDQGASPELNRSFVDPELDVDPWVERFETESREVFAQRQALVAVSGAGAGDRVADVGAGTGLFTRLFAEAVGGEGRVFAVEISPRFVEHIESWAAGAGADHVTVVLGRTDSTMLPEGTVDVAWVCDAYHHFEDPEPMLRSIRGALVSGGTLVVVDFEREPGVSREWVLDHVRAGKSTVRDEIEAAGFEFLDEVEVADLRENYVLRFRRP